ncbi:hypothetical protein BDY21DRAFT_109022 [Lineolata rhizophorae]|uniref:BZIP domain-containing protein n=1 Tax=Lineolata rhizophorae TaxID=578093 RepID=A0A6A6NS20_9PEZI|nr:hypothetical protein BDY21DRAFT_109022 [Lineolata rhizophorae]
MEPAPQSPDRKLTRSLGVASILNPAASDVPDRGSRRRSASQMESQSSSPVESSLAPTGAFPSRTGSSEPSSLGDVSPTMGYGGPAGTPRRILTPRSPTLHRSRSLGGMGINPPTGTIDAHQSPFLTQPRTYSNEPGVGNVPPLPTPPAGQRTGFNFPQPAHTPPLPTSGPSRRTSVGIPPSGSASPSTSYSSLSQAGTQPPTSTFSAASGAPSQQAFASGPASAAGAPSSLSLAPLPSDRERPYGISVTSGSQSNYQLLTVSTKDGPVQVPVEVQQASRLADEKRKRNAGASARFRARRKEKEKEAAVNIARLEQQLNEAKEEVEWNRRERTELARLLLATPGGDRHFPRPQSPRQHRMASQPSSTGTPSTASAASGAYTSYSSERPEQAGSEDRNVRRRTSYSLPGPQPSALTQQTARYQPQHFAPLVPGPPPVQQSPSAAPTSQNQYSQHQHQHQSIQPQQNPRVPDHHPPQSEGYPGRDQYGSGWPAGHDGTHRL